MQAGETMAYIRGAVSIEAVLAIEDLILDLPFKGDRDYLHSTDIFPALMELVRGRFGPQAQVESLTLRRPLRHGIQVLFEPTAVSSGSFRVRHHSECCYGWLVETDRPVTRRTPLDLPVVSAVAVSGQGSARILQPLQGSEALDVVVGLMKLVACQVDPRHWWLSQLNLDAPLTESFPIEVRILQNLGGQFLVLEILQASMTIGSARCMLEHKAS
jgi:hypothetical protein